MLRCSEKVSSNRGVTSPGSSELSLIRARPGISASLSSRSGSLSFCPLGQFFRLTLGPGLLEDGLYRLAVNKRTCFGYNTVATVAIAAALDF